MKHEKNAHTCPSISNKINNMTANLRQTPNHLQTELPSYPPVGALSSRDQPALEKKPRIENKTDVKLKHQTV